MYIQGNLQPEQQMDFDIGEAVSYCGTDEPELENAEGCIIAISQDADDYQPSYLVAWDLQDGTSSERWHSPGELDG